MNLDSTVISVVERVFAILAIVAALIAITGIIMLVRRRVPSWVRELALPLATAMTAVAAGGSVFASEAAGYVPCALCWYQRFAMYPLPLILGFAAFKGSERIWRIAIPIAAVGAVISSWHIAVEQWPLLGGDVCDPEAPCAVLWINEFGFLTLPTMALIGFVAVIVLTLLARRPATDA